jgi:drug/metabolite transporter, DME family
MTRTRSSAWIGTVLVTVAAASWGTWSLFLRPTALPATVTAAPVFLFIGLFALPTALRAGSVRWDRRARWLLLGHAVNDAINVLTFFAAMDHTSVAIAVLTHYVAPVLVALAAPWIDRERNPAAVGAAILALLGLALVLEPWNGASRVGLGAGLGLISAFCYAGNVFIIRRLAASIGIARTISYHSLLAAALLAPLLLVSPLPAVSWHAVGLIAAASLTIGAGAGVLYIAGLSRIGSARAGVLTFAEPLVAVLVGIIVWGEPTSATMMVGGALVIAAGVWVVRGGTTTQRR